MSRFVREGYMKMGQFVCPESLNPVDRGVALLTIMGAINSHLKVAMLFVPVCESERVFDVIVPVGTNLDTIDGINHFFNGFMAGDNEFTFTRSKEMMSDETSLHRG